MGNCGFPGKVGVVHDLSCHPVVVALAEPCCCSSAVLLKDLAGRNVVVTGGTKAVTQFELLYPGNILKPGFVGHGPRNGG